jgi:hypothetical protein
VGHGGSCGTLRHDKIIEAILKTLQRAVAIGDSPGFILNIREILHRSRRPMKPAPGLVQPETVDSLLAQLECIYRRYPAACRRGRLGRRRARLWKRLFAEASAYSSDGLVDRAGPPCKGWGAELGAHGTQPPDQRFHRVLRVSPHHARRLEHIAVRIGWQSQRGHGIDETLVTS